LDLGPQGGYVLFERENRVEPTAVVGMVQKNPREYRLEGALKLRLTRAVETDEGRFKFAAELLKSLGKAPPR
jgi:transcription-repair coupling factor (superfamily II helicase)